MNAEAKEINTNIINGLDTDRVTSLAGRLMEDEDYGKFQWRASNRLSRVNLSVPSSCRKTPFWYTRNVLTRHPSGTRLDYTSTDQSKLTASHYKADIRKGRNTVRRVSASGQYRTLKFAAIAA